MASLCKQNGFWDPVQSGPCLPLWFNLPLHSLCASHTLPNSVPLTIKDHSHLQGLWSCCFFRDGYNPPELLPTDSTFLKSTFSEVPSFTVLAKLSPPFVCPTLLYISPWTPENPGNVISCMRGLWIIHCLKQYLTPRKSSLNSTWLTNMEKNLSFWKVELKFIKTPHLKTMVFTYICPDLYFHNQSQFRTFFSFPC